MGWKIFLHAFRMMFRNHRVALQLVFPLVLVMLLNSVLATPDGGLSDAFNVILVVLFLATAIWAAVGWLRFVLLEDLPSMAVSSDRLAGLWQFTWRFALIGFVLSALSMPFGFFLLIASMLPESEGVMTTIVTIGLTAVSWVLFRWSPFLTAAALNEKMGLSQAWALTESFKGSLVIVAVLNGVFSWALPEVTRMIFGGLPFLWEPVDVVLTSFNVLLAASLLTAIHGVCVEGRRID